MRYFRPSSEQLSLDLRMPWEGRDPRVLTRGHLIFSFPRKGLPRPMEYPNRAEQLELFPKETSL